MVKKRTKRDVEDIIRRVYLKREGLLDDEPVYSNTGQGRAKVHFFFVQKVGDRPKWRAYDWRYPKTHRKYYIGMFCSEEKAAKAICQRLGFKDIEEIRRKPGEQWQRVLKRAPRLKNTIMSRMKALTELLIERRFQSATRKEP